MRIPSGLKKLLHTADKIIDIRHLRKHVIPDQQIGAYAFRYQPFCTGLAKELSTSVGMPFSIATLATFAAGSIPNVGIFFSLKYCSR